MYVYIYSVNVHMIYVSMCIYMYVYTYATYHTERYVRLKWCMGPLCDVGIASLSFPRKPLGLHRRSRVLGRRIEGGMIKTNWLESPIACAIRLRGGEEGGEGGREGGREGEGNREKGLTSSLSGSTATARLQTKPNQSHLARRRIARMLNSDPEPLYPNRLRCSRERSPRTRRWRKRWGTRCRASRLGWPRTRKKWRPSLARCPPPLPASLPPSLAPSLPRSLAPSPPPSSPPSLPPSPPFRLASLDPSNPLTPPHSGL